MAGDVVVTKGKEVKVSLVLNNGAILDKDIFGNKKLPPYFIRAILNDLPCIEGTKRGVKFTDFGPNWTINNEVELTRRGTSWKTGNEHSKLANNLKTIPRLHFERGFSYLGQNYMLQITPRK